MQYVLMEYVDKNNHCATSKARDDVERILIEKEGAAFIPLFRTDAGRLTKKLQLLKAVAKIEASLMDGDTVYLQYPYSPEVDGFMINLLHRIRQKKDLKICIIVHDVFSYRISQEEAQGMTPKEECALLSKADFLIVHNEIMKEFLRKNGCTSRMVPLEFFDYLSDGESADIPPYDPQNVKVIVAGNLSPEKAGYLYHLPVQPNVTFELYGINFTAPAQQRCVYHGSFPADTLIQNMSGHFGLVWDGESCETCSGSYGTYLKFNDPHKFSLYLAAGLPVIIWREAALAPVLEKYRVGFTIDKITDIGKIASSLTGQEYARIRQNVAQLRTQLRCGEKLLTAVRKTQ